MHVDINVKISWSTYGYKYWEVPLSPPTSDSEPSLRLVAMMVLLKLLERLLSQFKHSDAIVQGPDVISKPVSN